MIPPLYPSSPFGPHHVSLTIPIPEGGKCKKPLLIPDIDFIKKVIDGDIGIADNIIKSMLAKNLNSSIASSNEMVFRHFAKINDLDISDINKYKKNGKFSIPKDQIKISPAFDMAGIKALEKTVIKSIFETQKPFVEIVKIILGILVKIEDVIARFAPLLTLYPPTGTSMKPKVNGGVKKVRPQALGFDNGKEMKDALAKMMSLAKQGGSFDINPDTGEATKVNNTDKSSNNQSGVNKSNGSGIGGIGGSGLNNKGPFEYQIISKVFSTGLFNPKVNYEYTYIDIPADEELNLSVDLDDTDDPFDLLKPKHLIFGIFDQKGNPIDPNQRLKSFGISGNNIAEVDTPFKVADWILKSPKWKFAPGKYIWPISDEPLFVWERYSGVDTKISKQQPSNADGTPVYKIKKYKKGEKNIINGEEAIEGDPIISSFDSDAELNYVTYIKEDIEIKLSDADRLYDPETLSGPVEKIKTINKSIMIDKLSKLVNVKSQLENSFLYGQGTTSVYKENLDKGILKKSFRPFKISVSSAEMNKVASQNKKAASVFSKMPNRLKGSVWIDPESDYELKIIRIDPSFNTKFLDGKSEGSGQITTFVKNVVEFNIKKSDGSKVPFSVEIKKNSESTRTLNDLTDFVIDNWNFNYSGKNLKPTLANSNTYKIEIFRKDANPFYNRKNRVEFLISEKEFSNITTGINRKKILRKKYIEIYKNGNNWQYREFEKDFTFNYQNELLQSEEVGSNAYLSVSDGYKNIPDNNGNNGSQVFVKGGNITKWVVYRNTLGLDSVNFNTQTKILPAINKKNEVSFRFEDIGKIVNIQSSSVIATTRLTINTTNIKSFQLRLKDNNSLLLDPVKITNNHLMTEKLFSTGRYGHGTNENKQSLGVINRFSLTEFDNEPYYIIEGIKVSENDSGTGGSGSGIGGAGSSPNTNSNTAAASGGNDSKYYKLPHAIGAIKVLISIITDIASKLIPQIVNFIKLITNPPQFVTNIIIEKLGESFSMFSKQAIQVFKKIPELKSKFPDNSQFAEAANSFIRSSILSNYVYVDPTTGNPKFILDGVGLLQFALSCGGEGGKTLDFGLELGFGNLITGNGKILDLIFKFDQTKAVQNSFQGFMNKDVLNNKFADTETISGRALAQNQNKNKSKGSNENVIQTKANGVEHTDVVSVKYSTGEYIKGIEYEYIYITEQVEKLIREADELILTNDPKNLSLAKEKLEQAKKEDPNNKLIDDNLKKITEKESLFERPHTQPIIKFLLGLITLPIKIIYCIIKWIMDFFKSIVVLPTLPKKMIEFLSFKWILDFFSPVKLLELAGIKFDVTLLLDWITNLKNFKPGHVFDLTKVIDIAFLPPLFKVKKEQFLDVLKKPFRILFPILCLFEGIVNGFIDFVWALLGICPILKPPHIKLCKDLSDEPSTDDIVDLLMGLKDNEPLSTSGAVGGVDIDALNQQFSGGGSTSGDIAFVYDIKISDGRLLSDLNKEEMREFVDANKDQIDFEFLFENATLDSKNTNKNINSEVNKLDSSIKQLFSGNLIVFNSYMKYIYGSESSTSFKLRSFIKSSNDIKKMNLNTNIKKTKDIENSKTWDIEFSNIENILNSERGCYILNLPDKNLDLFFKNNFNKVINTQSRKRFSSIMNRKVSMGFNKKEMYIVIPVFVFWQLSEDILV
jgi:hypothetical protein